MNMTVEAVEAPSAACEARSGGVVGVAASDEHSASRLLDTFDGLLMSHHARFKYLNPRSSKVTTWLSNRVDDKATR
jgi:hypothetical protein